jgi:Fe-S cluster assembly iron-binding protein IscA
MEIDKTYVRVGINGMTCSGPAYAFGFDDEFSEEVDDLAVQGGLSVVNSKMFSERLSFVEIDYKDESGANGFAFKNTNPLQVMADSVGGCGSGGGCCGGGCGSV